MAFVLDVNLRIQEILGLQKVEAALAKLQGAAQIGTAAAGGAAVGGAGGIAAASKVQAAAAIANAAAINKVTVANNKLTTSQSKAIGTTQKAAAGMGAAASKADTFGKSVAIAGKRYGAFLAATVIPFAALAGIGKATASVIEFDSAMLKMRQITGQSEQQISGMRNTILDLAAATGTSASEIARIGKIMSQAGFRGEQLTEALTALSKVPLTPSFETIDAAVEGTIAVLNQFNKEGLTTTKILDVMTAVSNKFAASSEDIAKGIARGGAAFEAIGGTFREFVAMFTTIRQATRESAETVGTFMKTISSRLADPKIVSFLEGKGIRISEAIEAGNPIEALKRIGAAMANITSIQDRIEIGTKLGGRRQISRLLALMSNIDVLNDALRTAGASAGAFGEIAEVGLQGMQAQLNILVQELNKLVQTLAEPLFVPIIRGVTTAGKAFIAFIDFVKPIIPALTAVIGFAVGFKLLAVSISAAAKALAFMSAVGVGGGIPGILGALTGAGAGGAAGATARERIQRRLAGGVGLGAGGAAAAGGIGARLAGGAKTVATAPLGQLAGAAALIFVADKLSSSFEKAGNSSGVLASEFAKAAGVILIAISLLSGKSITGAIGGIITALGPWGAALAAGVAALGAFTFAATKAVDFDIQNIIDAAAQKVSEMEVPTIEAGDRETLQETVGVLGLEAIKGIQESANRFEEGFSGTMTSIVTRLKNLFAGEGLISISDTDAQQMIEDIVGNNPQLLNEILRSSIEQFGITGLEVGLDKLLAESFGGNIEVAARIRQAMVKQLGGFEKIARSIDQMKMDVKVTKLANAIEKASNDFESLHIPVQLSSELGMLSDAVGNAARAIETNVNMFDKLSQIVGRDVGVSKPGTEFTRTAIEQIARTGKTGEFIDLSLLPELEGFTTDMARVGKALEDFMKSIIKSKAEADSLRSLLADPQVDPFDILGDYIDKFIDEVPDKIPPEAEAAFKAAAANLGQQLRKMLIDQAGVLPSTEEVQKAFDSVLGKQQPFFEAAIDVFKIWMDTQVKQINLAISAEELLAGIDISTADLAPTIIESLQNAFKNIAVDFELPSLQVGLGNVNNIMIDLAQNGDLVGQVLDQYEGSYRKHAELNRQIAVAQQTGEGASIGLLKASKDAAIEVLNLQVALSLLAKIAQKAPQILGQQQEKRRELLEIQGMDISKEETSSMARFTKRLDESSQQIIEFINRQRQFIEAQTAIDISQAFREPADIFAQALRESADAVKIFTSALTSQDLQRGFDALSVRTTPEGRVFTERQPVLGAQVTEKQTVTDKRVLQSALFGGDISDVMETLLKAATEQSFTRVQERSRLGRPRPADVELAKSLRDFSGAIFDIPKIIQESGLDVDKIVRATAESLQTQARVPGAIEVEHIGALNRTIGDLETSLKSLIEQPEVAREPEQLIDQLSPMIQDLLQNLSRPVEQLPETEDVPRIFRDLSSSAENMKISGTEMIAASQGMIESAQQMQSVADTQRETLIGQQETAAGGVDGESAREAIIETTKAINDLGERMDAVTQAVEAQTKQQIELASVEEEKSLEIEGLEENTEALSVSSEAANKTQESISDLDAGMVKMAGAIEEGIAIDVATVSEIKVDVQGVSAAAQEFTSEFEAVAERVAKAEIRAILQQLARTAGNSESAATFENAVV